MHRHNFVAPESLGFDSDGSVLFCDKPNCTAWKLSIKKSSLFVEKRFAVAMGILTQGLLFIIPLIVAVPWYYYINFIVWGYLDFAVIKDWLKDRKSTEPPK